MEYWTLQDLNIVNYLYNLLWGEHVKDEEHKTEVRPVLDYQKIIEQYRNAQEENKRKDLVNYYKYGYF